MSAGTGEEGAGYEGEGEEGESHLDFRGDDCGVYGDRKVRDNAEEMEQVSDLCFGLIE